MVVLDTPTVENATVIITVKLLEIVAMTTSKPAHHQARVLLQTVYSMH